MASEKFMQLVDNLAQATSEGRVQWKTTDTDQEFVVNLGPVIVEVEKEDNEDELGSVYRYVVTLSSPKGKALELEIFDTDGREYDLASKLYELARKDALRIDLLIDSVINDLKKK